MSNAVGGIPGKVASQPFRLAIAFEGCAHAFADQVIDGGGNISIVRISNAGSRPRHGL